MELPQKITEVMETMEVEVSISRRGSSGDKEDVLKLQRNLICPPKVEKVTERVNVQRSAEDDGDEGPEDEPEGPEMLRKCEDADANVGKDEVLRDEVAHLKKRLGADARLRREVVVGVVGLADAAEEHRDDALKRKLKRLSEEKARVGAKYKERTLQQRVVTEFGVLGQQGGGTANQRALNETGDEDVEKVGEGGVDGEEEALRVVPRKGVNGAGQHDADDVVEDRLAKDEGVQRHVDANVVEDGQHGDRVGGADDGAKVEKVAEAKLGQGGRHEPAQRLHDAGDDEAADGGAEEGIGHDGAKVAEEELALQRVAGVEDDQRENEVEEDLRVKGGLFQDLGVLRPRAVHLGVLAGVANDRPHHQAVDDRQPCLMDKLDPFVLEQPNGADDEDEDADVGEDVQRVQTVQQLRLLVLSNVQHCVAVHRIGRHQQQQQLRRQQQRRGGEEGDHHFGGFHPSSLYRVKV
ncbi:hypothetical protein TYRP_013249 [Tyrophagus putrescentiae]|nr:hypothetical protein TYRP_013249 [Tyrophagus putrescentiae]